MSCLKPKKIKNPRYIGLGAHSIGEYSERVYGVRYPPNMYITVSCGKCINCQKRKFNDYRMRLLYELNRYPRSIFVTLTFDESNLKRFKGNPNKSIRLFLDRVRKVYGKQVRHWFVAEFGKKRGRLHYHGILFNCRMENEELEKYWQYGNTFVGYANEITAKYIVKYLTKDDTKGSKPPRVISSIGIGVSWLDTPECHILKKQLATGIDKGSYIIPLPRYYVDKMYSEREKEIISYYAYMESVKEWYVAGRKYTDERLANAARERLYRQYKAVGLIASTDNYERTPRIFAHTRFQVMCDVVSKNSFLQTYLTN